MTPAPLSVMEPQAALGEPLVRRVMARVIDRLDAQPSAERTHSIRIKLDAAIAPEIHAAESLSARAVAWASIDGIVAAEWAILDYRKHRKHGSREEREPYLDFRWSDSVEDLIRERLRRPRKDASYTMQWRALLTQANLLLSEVALARLAATPIEITGRCIDDVFVRFLSIRDFAQQPLLLREVASRVFWGLSKILDGRADAVAALLGYNECPFAEQPIVLNVHLIGEQPRTFLFVENHVAFERLKTSDQLREIALIFSSGFRGAAARLRKTGGCSVFYSRESEDSAIELFEQMLFSKLNFPVHFWGDLDYSGMAILASLRTIFPSAQAWQPGYDPMLGRLTAGDGHSPGESGKERQRMIEATGCPYADEQLLPALKASQRFLDQE
jgi:hypothetical protein